MLRREFIKMWADSVRDGRRKHHPNIRPSEEACGRMEDEKIAAAMWAKHRAAFAPLKSEHVYKLLFKDGGSL